MPLNWTRDLWVTETNVAGTFRGQKTRSTLLIALDNAIHTYMHATPTNKLRALQLLMDAFDAWARSKDDAEASIRNKRDPKYKDGALLKDFKAWMKAKEDGMMPAAEPGWDGVPNCYAYAMKCRAVAGQVPTPGAAAGHAVQVRADLMGIDYHAALFQGIVADAVACNEIVNILSDPDPHLNTYPLPTALPQFTGQADGAHYIAAMVVKADGFHFMRRDSTTHLWSHKNGGGAAEVETSALLLTIGNPSGDTRQLEISDDIAMEMLTCQAGRFMNFPGFRFAGYVLVPNDGITVRGAY